MASGNRWEGNAYIYREDHAANINAYIDAVVAEKGDGVTLEDFKQYDVLHLGGHAGIQRLIEEVGITAESKLFEVGSGLGGSSRFLHEHSGASVDGVDYLQHFVDLCTKMTAASRKSDKLAYQRGDINTIALPENQYDGAYTVAVYILYIRSNEGMKNVFKALKPGGWFYIEDWLALAKREDMPDDVADKIYEKLGWVGLRTEEEIRADLQDAGFVIEKWEDIGRQNSEFAWERSQDLFKTYREQGETGEPVFIKSVTDYGYYTAEVCPHLDHLTPEQIRERYPDSCHYITEWEDLIYRRPKYTSHARILARKPLAQLISF